MRILILVASAICISSCTACVNAAKDIVGPPPGIHFSSLIQSAPETEEPLVGGLYRITFSTTVDEKSADALIESIQKGNKHSQARGILLEINSNGGSVDDGFKIIKAIEKSAKPVFCVVDNEGYSMAFMILQSCHKRGMTKRATLMAHNPFFSSVPGEGTISNLEDWTSRVNHMSASWHEHCSSRLKISPAEFAKRVYRRDWWMNWQEAVEVGAVDVVLPSPNATLQYRPAPPSPPPDL